MTGSTRSRSVILFAAALCQLHDCAARGLHQTAGGAAEVAAQCSRAKLGTEQQLKNHGCVMEERVCMDQGKFILFNEHKVPGSPNYKNNILDLGYAFHNIPGYADNMKGTKLGHQKPVFRGNSSRDPPDIANPRFDACTLPLVWWPVWPFNYGEVFLQSMEPFWRMQQEGLFDRSVQFVAGMNGLLLPGYMQWLLNPLTASKVESLEDFSSREHMRSGSRSRCFEQALFCRPFNLWNRRPGTFDDDWHKGMRPSSAGQALVEFYRPQLGAVAPPDPTVLRVAFIERLGKRLILNLDDVIANCGRWRPAKSEIRTVRCGKLSFEGGHFLDWLKQLLETDVLVGVHGAGMANGFLMRPNTGVIEVRPYGFWQKWAEKYYPRYFRNENIQFFLRFQVEDPALSHAGALEQWARQGDNMKALTEEGWVEAAFQRDHDTIIDFGALSGVLQALVDVHGNRKAYKRYVKAYMRSEHLYLSGV